MASAGVLVELYGAAAGAALRPAEADRAAHDFFAVLFIVIALARSAWPLAHLAWAHCRPLARAARAELAAADAAAN